MTNYKRLMEVVMAKKWLGMLPLLALLLALSPQIGRADNPGSGGGSASGSVGTYGGDGPAVSFTDVSVNYTNGTWSLGWSFTTNVATQVYGLGFYDAFLSGGSSGLSAGCNCGEVGIYNSSGVLLASALVTSSDPASDFFRWASITPIILPAGGTYYIAAETGSAQYTWYTSGFAVSPDINFLQDQFVYSSTLAFPWESTGITAAYGGAWFGPNFEEQEVPPVPEPATVSLLGMGLLGLVGALRRKRQA
jgi:hypothetical protein